MDELQSLSLSQDPLPTVILPYSLCLSQEHLVSYRHALPKITHLPRLPISQDYPSPKINHLPRLPISQDYP